MKTLEILNALKNNKNLDIEKISSVDGDIVGASLFINILLSIGAFFSCLFILFFIGSFIALVSNLNKEFVWGYIGIVAAIMLLLGHLTYSAESLFRLRFSSFLTIFGKAALIFLIFERIGFFIGYENMFKSINYFLPIILLLAIGNMYISKTKFEAFFILFSGFFVVMFVLSTIMFSIGLGGEFGQFSFVYSLIIAALMWIFVAGLLLKFDKNYLYRLPFYGFITAQISLMGIQSILLFNREISVASISLLNWGSLFYNIILLAAVVYLIFKLQKNSQFKLGWQYITGFFVLASGVFLPIESLYIALFCLIYGYTYRDRFILVAGYLLMPLFVFKLYYSLQLTLDSASLLSFIVGIGFLLAYAIIRFSKFDENKAA